MNADKKNIAAADLPIFLRAVEEREREKEESIRLWLDNSSWMQMTIASEKRDASPSAELTSADWFSSPSVIKS